jgi:hypothetical protein
MTEENPAAAEPSPPALTPEEVEMERLCAELHASARKGELFHLLVILETTHPIDVRLHRIGIMYNKSVTREFVKNAENAIMEIAEERLGALPSSGEQRPH